MVIFLEGRKRWFHSTNDIDVGTNPLDWGYGSDGDDDNEKYVKVNDDYDEDYGKIVPCFEGSLICDS